MAWGFFKSIWHGIKKVGSGIYKGVVKPVGHAVKTAAVQTWKFVKPVAVKARDLVANVIGTVDKTVQAGGKMVSDIAKKVPGWMDMPKYLIWGAVGLAALLIFRAEPVGRAVATAAPAIRQFI